MCTNTLCPPQNAPVEHVVQPADKYSPNLKLRSCSQLASSAMPCVRDAAGEQASHAPTATYVSGTCLREPLRVGKQRPIIGAVACLPAVIEVDIAAQARYRSDESAMRQSRDVGVWACGQVIFGTSSSADPQRTYTQQPACRSQSWPRPQTSPSTRCTRRGTSGSSPAAESRTTACTCAHTNGHVHQHHAQEQRT